MLWQVGYVGEGVVVNCEHCISNMSHCDLSLFSILDCPCVCELGNWIAILLWTYVVGVCYEFHPTMIRSPIELRERSYKT